MNAIRVSTERNLIMEQVRLFFKKIGNIRYISHLDLQRTMIRILLRSGLDIAFSEGYNPRPKLAFAVPLSIYQESECEILDFKLNKDTSAETVEEKLRPFMPKGLEIIRIAEPKEKSSACHTARYRLTMTTTKSIDEIKELLSGTITVLKKTKTKEEECDIAPQITDRVYYEQDGKVILEAKLVAESGNYLNPNYITAFLGNTIEYCLIRRLCLYNEKGQPLE